MTTTKPNAATAKEHLVRTAERLFAEHGISGVSLRQISATSGNGNTSAVQYHFGSKQNLIQAILEYRLPSLNARRQLLIEQRNPGDLRGWVECFLLPVMELAEQRDSHYLTFLTQLQGSEFGEHPYDRLPASFHTLTHSVLDEWRALLPHIPEPLLSNRITQALATCVHASSDRERARARKAPRLPFVVHARDLIDGLVGFLTAPVSQEALDALEGVAIPVFPRLAVP